MTLCQYYTSDAWLSHNSHVTQECTNSVSPYGELNNFVSKSNHVEITHNLNYSNVALMQFYRLEVVEQADTRWESSRFGDRLTACR